MKQTVRHNMTLDYYDGPILFEALDPYGGHYLCMAIESESDEDQYAVFGIAPDQLRLFKHGSADLHDLILDRGESPWYIGRYPESNSEVLLLTEQNTPLAETKHMPDPGFLLYDRPPESQVIHHAREQQKLALEVTVDPLDSPGKNRIPVDTLAGLLNHVQKVVMYACNWTKRDEPSKQNAHDKFELAHSLDAIAIGAGSFRIIMSASEGFENLSRKSKVARGLTLIDELFSQASNPQKHLQAARKYRGDFAQSYTSFIKFLSRKEIGFSYAWAEPSDKTARGFSISPEQIKPLVDKLREAAAQQTKTVEFTGRIIQIDARKRTWQLAKEDTEDTEDPVVSGKTRAAGPDLGGLTLKTKRYRFICEEELKIQEISKGEKQTLYLTKIEELSDTNTSPF